MHISQWALPLCLNSLSSTALFQVGTRFLPLPWLLVCSIRVGPREGFSLVQPTALVADLAGTRPPAFSALLRVLVSHNKIARCPPLPTSNESNFTVRSSSEIKYTIIQADSAERFQEGSKSHPSFYFPDKRNCCGYSGLSWVRQLQLVSQRWPATCLACGP